MSLPEKPAQVTVIEEAATRPWLGSYPPDVPSTIDYPKIAIGDLLDHVAGRYRDAPALVFEDQVLSWGEVQALARRLAAGLQRLGIRRGDRVAVLVPNVPHFVIAYYAILRLGAVVVAGNPLFNDEEIADCIGRTGARVIITLDVLFDKIAASWRPIGVEHVVIGRAPDLMPFRMRFGADLVGRLRSWAEVAGRLNPRLEQASSTGLKLLGRDPRIQRLLTAPRPKARVRTSQGIHGFRDMLRVRPQTGQDPEVKPQDTAALLFTTGTTGRPRAVTLSHANLLANAYQMRTWFPDLQEGRETILAVLPFFHAYGLSLVMNAGLVLAARSVLIPRVVLTDIFEAIQKYRPSALPGVPALFVSITNSKRASAYDLRSIRVCVSGGAPLPAEVKQRFEVITGGRLYEGYGLTEASPLTHAQPHDHTEPGSIGLPVADTEARIVDDEGRSVAQGERGELVVRGPQVMRGYWQEPEATAQALSGGWLHTGDIATMDDKGFFYVVDRKKDLIITAGENIAPREIEEVLYGHPAVAEAAVAGVPHQAGGEFVKAFVVLKPGAQLSQAQLRRWLRDRLAHYKVPREIEFRGELPKAPMGKILRRVLVEQECSHLDRDAESASRKASSESAQP